MKSLKMPPTLAPDAKSLLSPRQFRDTDPQMLFAMWNMEMGVDPDRSLNEVEHAVVAYDKFRPGIRKQP